MPNGVAECCVPLTYPLVADEGGASAADGYGGAARPLASGAPSSPRRQGYAGLLNQGNTCYLNSLVQGLYATPEVRRSLYSLSEKDLVVEMDAADAAPPDVLTDDKASTTQSRAPPPSQPQAVVQSPSPSLSAADVEALELLCGMGFMEHQVRRAIARFPVDPDNMQRVEFILSGAAEAVQPEPVAVTASNYETASTADDEDDGEESVSVRDLFSSSGTNDNNSVVAVADRSTASAASASVATGAVAGSGGSGGGGGGGARQLKERRIPKELQLLFARMQSADANAQSTKRLTECFGAGFSVAIQHDVHELNRILFDRLEKQLRGTAIHDLINQLYRGTVVNRIVCKSCDYRVSILLCTGLLYCCC